MPIFLRAGRIFRARQRFSAVVRMLSSRTCFAMGVHRELLTEGRLDDHLLLATPEEGGGNTGGWAFDEKAES